MPPGALPERWMCALPVLEQHVAGPLHSRWRATRRLSSMLAQQKCVAFLQRVPNWQKSPLTILAVPLRMAFTKKGRNQSLDVIGFSRITGVLDVIQARNTRILDLAHLFPRLRRAASAGETCSTPQGRARVRMTDVRSLAEEKLVHGVAIITEPTRPARISETR
jgi:hypothetical protein